MPGRDGRSGIRHQRTADTMASEDIEQLGRRYVCSTKGGYRLNVRRIDA